MRRRQGVGQHGLAAAQLAREVLLSVDRHGRGRVEHIGGDGQHLVTIERVAQRDGESRVAAGEVIEEDRRELHGDRSLDRRRQLGDQRQALAAVGDLVVGQRRPGVGRGGDDGHVHRRADAVLDGQALDERDVLGDALAVDEQLDGEGVQARQPQRQGAGDVDGGGRRDVDRQRRAVAERDRDGHAVHRGRQVAVEHIGQLHAVVDRAVGDDAQRRDGRRRGCRRRRRFRGRGGRGGRGRRGAATMPARSPSTMKLADHGCSGATANDWSWSTRVTSFACASSNGDPPARTARGGEQRRRSLHVPSRSSCMTTSCSGRRRNPCGL